MRFEKVLVFCLALLVSVMLVGCGMQQGNNSSAVKVGVSMPTKVLQRWNQDGASIAENLGAKGYAVDLQYADNKASEQVAQIEKMIAEGCKVLVVAAVDDEVIFPVLEKAKAADCKVIAYDRMIEGTKNIDGCVTFDNHVVGKLQGEYIEKKLGLKEGKGPFCMEIMAGSTKDATAEYAFNGAMEVLKPYIDSGKLVIRSGQKTLEECEVINWETAKAEARMEDLLNSYYMDGGLDAVLCTNDSIALGVENALKADGYVRGDMPIITGQDADLPNVKAIVVEEQAMTVFGDTRVLAKMTAEMVERLLSDQELDKDKLVMFYNGAKEVPCYYTLSKAVDKNNYKKVLVDSGYYKESAVSWQGWSDDVKKSVSDAKNSIKNK